MESEQLANVALLLGCHQIVQQNAPVDDVEKFIKPIVDWMARMDHGPPPSLLTTLRELWRGLVKGRACGWIQMQNLAEHSQGGDPLHGDLQVLVPGKIVTMKGPKELPDGSTSRDVFSGDGALCHRDFSPRYYLRSLRALNVQAVVRLSRPEYDADAFRAEGLAFVDLYCEDGACPRPEAVAKFLRVLEAVPGPVAVHSSASLGRVGTLAALYLMRAHGFAAREAIAWLRLVRPGSVVGPQEQYLMDREAVMARARSVAGLAAQARNRPSPARAAGVGSHRGSVSEAADAAACVAAALGDVDRRLGALRDAGAGRPELPPPTRARQGSDCQRAAALAARPGLSAGGHGLRRVRSSPGE